MKKSEDIFFFTLIDFLIQACFFGLVLYGLAQHSQQAEKARIKTERETIDKALRGTGVSNLTELTDELTKLAPVKDLRALSEIAKLAGGPEALKKLQEVAAHAGGAEQLAAKLAHASEASQASTFIANAGGVDKITASLEKLRKFEEGSGKPPCLFNLVGDKRTARPVATVVASDATIQFKETNPDLDQMLAKIGRTFDDVRELPLAEFARVFALVNQRMPECRYTLRFLEKTSLIHARDAARFSFYLNISKS